MARTMGEVLPSSFHALFSLAPRPRIAGPPTDDGPAAAPSSLFVDVGSGYGTLCVAAVTQYGFGAAVGIEKYREPLVRCDAALAALDPPTRSRLTVHHADVADVDLHAVLSSAAPPGTPTLLFCNNLAFPPGTAVRHGRQYASWAASWGGPVAVVTSTPIDAGVGRAPAARLALTMNFNQGHEVCVYVWGEEEEGESDGQRRAGEGGRRLEAGEAAAA